MAPGGVTPVTIVCGLPGAGRTGLPEHILADPRFADTVVVQSAGSLFAGTAACLCCRIASELVARLRELHFARATGATARFRRAIVEAVGAADPASILATLAELPLVAARYAPAGIITVADATHALEGDVEACRRIAMADRVVATDEVRDLDAARLLDLDPYAAVPAKALPGSGIPGIRQFTWEGGTAASAEAFGAALEALAARHGERIVKVAGQVPVADSARVMGILGTGHTLFPPAWLERSPGARTASRLLFTVRNLEEAAVAQILNPSAPAPSHNNGLRNPRADHGRNR